MSDGTDTKIYERLNDLEIEHGRHDERLKTMEKHINEFQAAIKNLEKVTVRSDVRVTVIVGILIFAANWFFKHF